MYRSSSSGLGHRTRYGLPNETLASTRRWEEGNMYKTSYLKQSEKNEPALKNSTLQLLQAKSNQLRSVSVPPESASEPVKKDKFIAYDYNNLYRTSYSDMSSSVSQALTQLPKLVNKHFVPGTGCFVPGMKAENSFGATFTNLANDRIKDFDKKRFDGTSRADFKSWQYNPMYRTHGSFWKNRPELKMENSLRNHRFTQKLRESGYSNNHATFDKTGWRPDKSLDSDMSRTEYRIQFNPKKEIHYKGPMFSTGLLKRKEHNYKHT